MDYLKIKETIYEDIDDLRAFKKYFNNDSFLVNYSALLSPILFRLHTSLVSFELFFLRDDNFFAREFQASIRRDFCVLENTVVDALKQNKVRHFRILRYQVIVFKLKNNFKKLDTFLNKECLKQHAPNNRSMFYDLSNFLNELTRNF